MSWTLAGILSYKNKDIYNCCNYNFFQIIIFYNYNTFWAKPLWLLVAQYQHSLSVSLIAWWCVKTFPFHMVRWATFKTMATSYLFNTAYLIHIQLWWCCAQDLFGSQILVITRGFELWISCIQSSYLTHYVVGPNRLGGFGVPEFATLRQE